MFLSSAQQRKWEEREQQALCDEKRISEVGDGGGIVVDLVHVEAESAEDALVERKAAFIGVVPLVCCFFYRRGFGFGKRARGERARARRKRDECGEGKKTSTATACRSTSKLLSLPHPPRAPIPATRARSTAPVLPTCKK